MMPSEEERGKKKKEAIVYQSGNDTVIQPIGKKDNAGVRTLLNIMLGVVIGVGVAWFLLLPAKVQNEQIKAQAEKNAISEQLDAKAVEVAEMTKQIESLMQEKSNLNVSLNEAQGVNAAVIASNDLMEASVMYLNKTGDEMQIAAIMEEITDEYLEKDATEEFIALYQVLLGEIGAKVAQTYYTTGYEALRTEEYETAIENLTKAFKYEPKNGEALFNLGNAYRKSGDEASAVSVYKQVVELFPDSEKAKKSQKYIEDIQGA